MRACEEYFEILNPGVVARKLIKLFMPVYKIIMRRRQKHTTT